MKRNSKEKINIKNRMEIPTTTSVLNYDVSTNGFTFRKRQERVNWKKLASIDIEKLSHNLDFHCLQDNIVHITFCDIEHEVDRNSVDPNYIKLFKLAQLIIEYLLHSQEYLANIIQNLEEKLKQSLDNLEEEKAARSKDQKIVNDLRKECKNRKRQLAAQQQYFESLNKQYSQCSHCPKTFIGPSFLKSHILRRHPEFAEKISNFDDDDDTRSKENTNALIALGKQLEDIKEKFKNSMGTSIGEDEINKNKIIEEKSDKENDTLLKSIEEWKKDEMKKHSAELEAVQNTLMKELKEMQRKHQKSEVALKELQEKYAEVTQSYLEKTNHHSSDLEREQEVEALKEEFKSQLTFVESDLQKYLKKQEKEWQKKMDKQLHEHNSEIEKLNIALQESIKQIKNEQEKKAFNEKYYEKQIQKLMDVSKKQDYLIQEQEKKLKEISLMQNQLKILNKSPPPPPPPRTYTVNKCSQSFPKESQVDKQEDYSLINYRVKTALKSNPGLLNGLRTELCGFLEDKLQSYGINPFVKTINNKLFHKGIESSKDDQNHLIKKYEKFNDIRNYCENFVNKMASDSINSLKRKSKLMKHLPDQESYVKKNITSVQSPILNSKNILTSKEQKSVVDSFDSSPKFHHPVTSSSPKHYSFASNSHISSSKLVSSKLTNSIEYSNTFKSPTLQHSFDKSKIPEDDSSNTESNEGGNSEIFNDRLKTFQEVRPIPIPRKLLTEPKRVSFEDEKSSSEVTESSESYVESSNSSDPEEDTELSQYQPIRVKPPSGEKVTKLTQSIENQLMGRQTKPPPGAIDVTPTANVVSNQLILEKTLDKSDDDFSLSAIENELKTFETEIQNYKSEKVTKKLHSDINSAWSTSKNEKFEIQEKSSIKKGLSSWDSDEDISIEEIQ